MIAITQADSAPAHPQVTARYELRFNYLDRIGRAVVFPCDQRGAVDLQQLSPSLRESYRRASSRVGRDLACPAVLAHMAEPARGPRLHFP